MGFFSSLNETVSNLNMNTSGSALNDPCLMIINGSLFLIAVEILTAVVGFPGNAYVVYLMLRGEVERSTSDVYILSLAILDMVNCLVLVFHPLYLFTPLNFDISTLGYFILGLTEVGGPLFLNCIAIDRYIAVVHPVLFLKFTSGHHRYMMAAFIWVSTLGHSFFVAFTSFEKKEYIFVAVFLASFQVMLLCNFSLLRALRKSGPASAQLHPIKRKAFCTVLAIFLISIVSYLPLATVYPFKSFFSVELFTCYIFPNCYAFITLRAILQALFFLIRARKLPCMTSDLDENDEHFLCC